MANNLKLITTETFGDLSCNFYRNMNDDILLTREQIGTALEYVYPNDALSKIHRKHCDRLNEFSVVAKLASTDRKEYEATVWEIPVPRTSCRVKERVPKKEMGHRRQPNRMQNPEAAVIY